MNPHHNVNANRMKSLMRKIQKCLNHVFLLWQLKNYQGGINLTQKKLRGPATWKDMPENALRHAASRQTRVEQLYEVSSPCLEDHQVKQEELESVGELTQVCSQIVFENACTWHELDDQTICGLSTNLQEQSQNGLRLATDDWQD